MAGGYSAPQRAGWEWKRARPREENTVTRVANLQRPGRPGMGAKGHSNIENRIVPSGTSEDGEIHVYTGKPFPVGRIWQEQSETGGPANQVVI